MLFKAVIVPRGFSVSFQGGGEGGRGVKETFKTQLSKTTADWCLSSLIRSIMNKPLLFR